MDNNLNVNKDVNGDKKNTSKIIIIAVVVLLVGALGFLGYDKLINKEKPTESSETNESTTNNDTVKALNKVVLTTENQSIKIGNNSFNVRIPDANRGGLFINDSLVRDYGYGVDTVYVADNFAFFTLLGQFDSFVEYAIDSKGNEIKIETYNHYIHDIHLDNGLIVGKGTTATAASYENSNVSEEELVIKYEDNVVTITQK